MEDQTNSFALLLLHASKSSAGAVVQARDQVSAKGPAGVAAAGGTGGCEQAAGEGGRSVSQVQPPLDVLLYHADALGG
eukprot:scaffold1237_cov243-Pinguiococcus_pyrenoidosus.AAC.34